ncbi:MAG: hypothetical protein ACMUJM_15545 [bacterium]
MSNELKDLINNVRGKYLNKKKPIEGESLKDGNIIKNYIADHKKGVALTVIALILLVCISGMGGWYLGKDYLLKRQHFPERNVLFRSCNVIFMVGGTEARDAKGIDYESITKVYEGGIDCKVGTYLFETTREVREDIEMFNMDNSQMIRTASATKKPEKVQAGLRIGGSLNFREQIAEIIGGEGSKSSEKYTVYKFIPERGSQQVEITVTEDDNGNKNMENRLVELHYGPHGWLFGKIFRRGTLLQEYKKDAVNDGLIQKYLHYIKSLNSQESTERATREKIIRDAMQSDKDIKVMPIYSSYEDGIVDLLPQESSIYLGEQPGFWEKLKNSVGINTKGHYLLRVENYWDLWPGRYPWLAKMSIGDGDNVIYPFDKYNNGGYVIKDRQGDIARIDIKDFILFYGQDVLYQYYLDLDGNGKIDKNKELIGKVLCRATHDEKINLEKVIGKGEPKRDITVTVNYSFMAPDSDMEKGLEYFKLCGYVESLMPDQINRGFGKHSMLGYINQQRSDIMLYLDLKIENMSRVLTQESTLVAKYDIVKVLQASQRSYAREVSQKYGI